MLAFIASKLCGVSTSMFIVAMAFCEKFNSFWRWGFSYCVLLLIKNVYKSPRFSSSCFMLMEPILCLKNTNLFYCDEIGVLPV
jgi:hypothetical protein